MRRLEYDPISNKATISLSAGRAVRSITLTDEIEVTVDADEMLLTMTFSNADEVITAAVFDSLRSALPCLQFNRNSELDIKRGRH